MRARVVKCSGTRVVGDWLGCVWDLSATMRESACKFNLGCVQREVVSRRGTGKWQQYLQEAVVL